ncbi:sulfatase [Flammeovirga sp. MY04]|uniref:sulfatase family protein n=1 Tax=Flammeovirga sp. MY04 TaxID=1191459 RepID=UPI0008264E46|nr:sulfatase [Flammeovirga sp. MY04]ANQ52706.2 sulfatase [Flammeovirga sp. MY04]
MKLLKLILLITSISIIGKAQSKQPNIVWISFEDMSPVLSCYGDSTANTPNINALSKESQVFNNAFSTAGVCAPSRSAIITGMYPISIGTNHMRTGRDIMGWGNDTYREEKGVLDKEGNNVREYSAVLPEEVKCFTEYLRKEGYYCTNNAKTDYQFAAPFTAWDENDTKAHWRNRGKYQPFFAVFNFNETHESKIWKNKDLPLTVDKNKVSLPTYYPDTPEVREDMARMYANLELLDKRVGYIIDQLKKDGLYENTYIFFFSDHGGPLPRQKREVIASGLHVPFMIKYPNAEKVGYTDQLINFIDLAPSMIELAGGKIPHYLQGRSFFSEDRKYSFAARDRMDEFTSARRSVTDGRYLYVRYLEEDATSYQDINYRLQIPTMRVMKEMYEAGELNDVQSAWFNPLNTNEMLFDLSKDPEETNNLITSKEHAKVVKRFRGVMDKWLKSTSDICIEPEAKMIEKMWPNNQQPTTSKVIGAVHKGELKLSCTTKGASIGYQINEGKWKVYHQPIVLKEGDKVSTKAIRIGYKESEITIFNK